MKDTVYAKAFRLGQRADSPEPLNSKEWCELAYPLEDHVRKMIERSFHKGYTASQASYAAALAQETRERVEYSVKRNKLVFRASEDMVISYYDAFGNLNQLPLHKGQKIQFGLSGALTADIVS